MTSVQQPTMHTHRHRHRHRHTHTHTHTHRCVFAVSDALPLIAPAAQSCAPAFSVASAAPGWSGEVRPPLHLSRQAAFAAGPSQAQGQPRAAATGTAPWHAGAALLPSPARANTTKVKNRCATSTMDKDRLTKREGGGGGQDERDNLPTVSFKAPQTLSVFS